MNWSNLLLQFFLCYVSTVCFGILLNIPKRAYHTAGMIGGGVWVVYWIMYYCSGIGLAFSNLVAAILFFVSFLPSKQPILVLSLRINKDVSMPVDALYVCASSKTIYFQ